MNNLVIPYKQEAVTSSIQIANSFNKKHQHVLRNIDALKKDLSNFGQMFMESTEPDSYGRNRRIYYMNRDGFSLLAMGFTGKKALQFKLKYIEAFNQMEKELREKNVPMLSVEERELRTKELENNKAWVRINERNAYRKEAELLVKMSSYAGNDELHKDLLNEALKRMMALPISTLQDPTANEYTASYIGDKLHVTAYQVGAWANELGIKAPLGESNKYGRWRLTKGRYSEKVVYSWLYSQEGFKAIVQHRDRTLEK